MSSYQERQVAVAVPASQFGTFCLFILVFLGYALHSYAQATATPQAQGAPITITLQDALQRAQQNDPQYRSAMTDLGLAREDRVQGGQAQRHHDLAPLRYASTARPKTAVGHPRRG